MDPLNANPFVKKKVFSANSKMGMKGGKGPSY
jgi:hypothetical protein